MARKNIKLRNVGNILRLLERAVGESEAVVRHEEPFFVLISTVLSQRTRDENTEKASRNLFNVYNTPEELAAAPIPKIESLIKSVGFHRTKARNIKELSRIIVEEFNGKTPEEISELLSLPGVGRKTANCVLVYAYNKPAIPVDTHVHRISNRLGWVNSKSPEETEKQLEQGIQKKYWIKLNNLMVKFGQKICLPVLRASRKAGCMQGQKALQKPGCGTCPLKNHCQHYKKNWKRGGVIS